MFAGLADPARAVANPNRIEILEFLGQGDRSVETVAERLGLSVANASQHLRLMQRAGLLASRRDGKRVLYGLGDAAVVDLMSALSRLAERRTAEVQAVVACYFCQRDGLEPVSRSELLDRMAAGLITVLDVRPGDEFALGHLPGALNIPLAELERRLGEPIVRSSPTAAVPTASCPSRPWPRYGSAASPYDQKMAELRAQREAEDRGFESPVDLAQDALRSFQKGPTISRPNLAESFIPVVGPAWEAAADLQEGNYGGAALNGALAVADALPVGVAIKGLRAASKGVKIVKEGSVTANAAAKQLRRLGVVNPGEEIHHTIPLNGTSRTAQDWRNHYAFLKPLPQEIHRRLTGSWGGKPRFDPIRRVWYGTTDWMKAVPTGLAAYATDAWENVTQPFGPPPSEPPSNAQR